MSTDPTPGTTPGADDDPFADLQVPDDLSGLDATDEPTVAVVVTQVAVAGALAAACSLAQVDVDAVPSPVGAIAVLRDPAAGATATAAISQLLRQAPVVLLERRAEQVSATQWVAGAQTKELPPGLVLSGAPEVLEDLLLGDLDPATVDGTVTSVGLSRWKAMRMIAGNRPRG